MRYPGEGYQLGDWQPERNPYTIASLPGITGLPAFTITAVNYGGGVIAYKTNPPEEVFELLALAAPELIKAALPYVQYVGGYLGTALGDMVGIAGLNAVEGGVG
jgi:hypothetical protein